MNINKFIILNILILICVIYLAYRSKKSKSESLTFTEFINNGELPDTKNLILGLSFGFLFGFIDNFSLWIGVDSIQRYIPGNILTKSAWGNTYSSVFGSIVSTCLTIIFFTYFKTDEDEHKEPPIWLTTLGIFLGCITGIFIGKMVSKK